MKKITTSFILNFITENKIHLCSSHKVLSVPIINRITKKMKIGINFNAIKIHQNIIIDGHHRYISSLLAGINLDSIETQKTSATQIYDWKNIEFVDEEWDTQLKINQLNKIDAAYNNIDIEKLIEITK